MCCALNFVRRLELYVPWKSLQPFAQEMDAQVELQDVGQSGNRQSGSNSGCETQGLDMQTQVLQRGFWTFLWLVKDVRVS